MAKQQDEVSPKEPDKPKVQPQGKEPSILESLVEKARGIGGPVWDFIDKELGDFIRQGNSELAAAMYTGSGYVMYGQGMNDDSQQPAPSSLEELDAKAKDMAKQHENEPSKSKSKGQSL